MTRMKVTDWYNNASEPKKNIFLLGIVTAIGFAATFIFFFMNNPGVPLGWLFGSAIEIVCYITIVKGTTFLLDPNKLNRKRGFLAPLFMVLRLALYAGGLVLGAFCTYKWGTMACSYLNFWAVFAGYMPLPILLVFVTIYRLKKQQTETPVAPQPSDDNKDAEEND